MLMLQKVRSQIPIFKHPKVSLNFFSAIKINVIWKLRTHISRLSKNCTYAPWPLSPSILVTGFGNRNSADLDEEVERETVIASNIFLEHGS